jgi:nitroimidazol reductase NimA-like FMN-containing flavoprotein (pyridoxamine 5'-phosphate oxidase superfamily)
MALTKLTPDETKAFLNRTRPALLGVIGTLGADGYPHLVPVWYRYDGELVHIWTLETRAWVKNLSRDDRAAVSVQENELTSTGALLKGRATIRTSAEAWVTEQIWAITRRYIPDEAEARVYIEKWRRLRTIVSLRPEKINGWRDV